ncbi:hypothetical protein [Rhodococcus sp. NPDC076796]|nr:hypothetical protein [Rhodococcus sp. (in: high G+C Gram-positive bacteria)]
MPQSFHDPVDAHFLPAEMVTAQAPLQQHGSLRRLRSRTQVAPQAPL